MPTGSFDRLPAFTDDEVVVVVETPKGSRNKYAYDETLGVFEFEGVPPEGARSPMTTAMCPRPKAATAILSTSSC